MKFHRLKKIYGDFQTPTLLADHICTILTALNITPKYVIEPTCGMGNILLAAIHSWKEIEQAYGLEINFSHLETLKKDPKYIKNTQKISLFQDDFFHFDLSDLTQNMEVKSENELLIIGNPPWVTNSELGALNSENLPSKRNFNGDRGIEAITGKSNFDISEFIILDIIRKLTAIPFSLAMLCKTSVARKILMRCWKDGIPLKQQRIFMIDATKHFAASVDACLFFCQNDTFSTENTCRIYDDLDFDKYNRTIGYENNRLISDIQRYEKYGFIDGVSDYIWRNGFKHDASKVMEFREEDGQLYNGFNQIVEIEPDLIYPLLKSSDIANGKTIESSKFVLVTQHYVGEDTKYIKYKFPKTWNYLELHEAVLNNRKSSIYKNKAKYAVFSVGEYAFSNYKIAISSLYKKLNFRLIGSFNEKPFILDDTCNYIACNSLQEAEFVLHLLSSGIVTEYLNSIIFWDNKRVITTEILNSIDLAKVANKLFLSSEYYNFTCNNKFSNHSLENSFPFYQNCIPATGRK